MTPAVPFFPKRDFYLCFSTSPMGEALWPARHFISARTFERQGKPLPRIAALSPPQPYASLWFEGRSSASRLIMQQKLIDFVQWFFLAAVLLVAGFLSCLTAMRLAIRGNEVNVPNLGRKVAAGRHPRAECLLFADEG